MDHSDTAYRRRPEQSNPAGSRSLRRSNRNSDDDGAGADVDLECRGRDRANGGYLAGDA